MENHMYVSTIADGITFRSVRETRFKNACISVHFLIPLRREYATVNVVMLSLLQRSCSKYPEYTELGRELAMLYGTGVGIGVSNLGNCQMLTIEMSMTDDRFIPDGECISVKCAELLSELIFRPSFSDDGSLFRDDDIEVILRETEERILSRINDKAEYAMFRCSEIMCEGEPCGIAAGGYLEDLPGITHETLADAWHRMLSMSAVNIIMVGGASHEPVERIFAREFAAIDRSKAELPAPPEMKHTDKVREVTERMEVQQSKMIIGMRLPIIEPDDRTMAARLMSMLYGGGTTSLLFNQVREKLSLCYYCSSSYTRSNGLLYVTSGIEEANYSKAVEEIKRQLKIIAENEFTDDEFNASKLFAVSAFAKINDSIDSIERWYALQFLAGCVRTPEQAAERMQAVTREQVAQCAALAEIDTIYLLAPEMPDSQGEREGGQDDE